MSDTMPTLDRARRGDHQAFADLLREHDDAMRGLAWQLLLDRTAMDDALQDAYVRAFRGLATFRGDAAFSTWLYRIVYRTCIDHLRTRRRHASLDEIGEPPVPGDATAVIDHRLALEGALADLSPEHRAVVLLVDREGYSYDDVAEMLGIAPGTVASRLSRARSALRAALGIDAETAADEEER